MTQTWGGGKERMRATMAEQAGEQPQGYARVDTFDPTAAPPSKQQIGHGPGGRAAGTRSKGLNARAVADVLESYGLDPVEEIAKILQARKPVLDREGKPVLDELGNPQMVSTIADDLRLRTLNELAQYTRPKLKAVEVTVKAPELTDEQIDRRLEGLLRRRDVTGS